MEGVGALQDVKDAVEAATPRTKQGTTPLQGIELSMIAGLRQELHGGARKVEALVLGRLTSDVRTELR